MFHETDRMVKHRQTCAVCQAATSGKGENDVVRYMDCCDTYGEMFENVIDYESSEGPFEDKPDNMLMCVECDGPVLPGENCAACGTHCPHAACELDTHSCSSSDCVMYEPCGLLATKVFRGPLVLRPAPRPGDAHAPRPDKGAQQQAELQLPQLRKLPRLQA
jgi:hypothetical protein